MLESCRECKKAIKTRSVLYCLDCSHAYHLTCLPLTSREHDPLYFRTPPPWRCPHCLPATGIHHTCRTCQKTVQLNIYRRSTVGFGFGVGWACGRECARCMGCGKEYKGSFSKVGCFTCKKRERVKRCREAVDVEGGLVVDGVWFWSPTKDDDNKWVRMCFNFRDDALWCAGYKCKEFQRIGSMTIEVLRDHFKSVYSGSPFKWEPIVERLQSHPNMTIVKVDDDVEKENIENPTDNISKQEQEQVSWKLSAHNNRTVNPYKPLHPTTLQSTDHPNVHVSRSPIAGFGLFAARSFHPHEPIIQYLGQVITKTMSDHRERLYHLHPHHRHSCYLFSLNNDLVVDATLHGNQARFINHSCQPNCDAKIVNHGEIWIVARRRVQEGEELFYDYKFSESEVGGEEDRVECRCGARRCRRYI